MAEDDWRHKRAVELGLIDTGPWLGGKAARPAPHPPAGPSPGRGAVAAPPLPPPSDAAANPPSASATAPTAAAAAADIPHAARLSPVADAPPIAPRPISTPTHRAPSPAAATARAPAPALATRRFAPWHFAAAAAAMALAFAVGWLLRAATTPSAFDRVLAAAPAVIAPANPPVQAARPGVATSVDRSSPPMSASAAQQPAPLDVAATDPPPTPSMSPSPLPAPARIPAVAAETRPPAAPVVPPAAAAPPVAPAVAPTVTAVPVAVADKPAPTPPIRSRRWTPPRAVAAPGRDFKPSFNCRRATATVTRAICADAELAALDREMSNLYGARQRTADREAQTDLDSDQSDFLNARSRCATSACIARSYRNRIRELR